MYSNNVPPGSLSPTLIMGTLLKDSQTEMKKPAASMTGQPVSMCIPEATPRIAQGNQVA
ncbi:MAG: hypothetical protein QM749_00235 [Aquabacterium sp.]